MIKNTLTFASGNAKLSKDTAILSLPAGHTCPFAKECRSHADRVTGKIVDGKHCQFRCYAASAENLFPNVRKSRWQNFELLRQHKTAIGMANLLENSLLRKKNIKLVRFHQSGDFFSQAYFDAWLILAQQHPELTIYGYTKALPFWAKRLNLIPANFKLVASRGGTHDHLIDLLGLRSVKVVFTEKEAADAGLELDHDDTHVWKYDKSFAILLHGNQPAGSTAGKALYKLRKEKKGGYKSDYFAHYKGGKKTVKVKSFKGIPIINGKPIDPKLITAVQSASALKMKVSAYKAVGSVK